MELSHVSQKAKEKIAYKKGYITNYSFKGTPYLDCNDGRTKYRLTIKRECSH